MNHEKNHVALDPQTPAPPSGDPQLELPATFADTLRKRRLGAKLSMRVLARLAGLSLNTIRNVERGTTYPTAETLARLFRVKPLRLALHPDAEVEADPGQVSAPQVCHGGEQVLRLTVEVSRLQGELARLRQAVGLPSTGPRRPVKPPPSLEVARHGSTADRVELPQPPAEEKPPVSKPEQSGESCVARASSHAARNCQRCGAPLQENERMSALCGSCIPPTTAASPAPSLPLPASATTHNHSSGLSLSASACRLGLTSSWQERPQL